MYKCIIFDLDGVLIETEGIHISAITKSFADKGYKLGDEDIKSLIARAPIEYVPEITRKHGWDIGELSNFLDLFRKNFHPVWDKEVELKTGLKELLDILKLKNIQIDLATNSSLKTVNKFASKFGLEKLFTNITSADEVKRRKPDPEIYLFAKNKTNLSDDEIIVVEDSEVGLHSAKQAGLKVVIIPTTYTRNQNFSEADYVFQTILEISNLFKDA